MDTVLVVPGIMGSELFLDGDQLWPPPAIGKVKDPDRLLDDGVVVGDIIRDVLIFGFYSKLMKPLEKWGFSEQPGGTKGLVLAWPYNWVKGIPHNAALLAQQIRAAVARHPDNAVVLLAHSMGGLIATYALECLASEDVAWRGRVRLLVTFGTPFHGAPESLKNAFGLEGAKGIAADDCQRLMADPRFPSAYQLFPHLTAHAIWESRPPLLPLSDYPSLNPLGPPLGHDNMKAAVELHRELHSAVANPGTRKFNFCGSVYSTAWSAWKATGAGAMVPNVSKAGDGTVPSWSGRQNDSVQFAPLGGKHSTTFDDDSLLNVLRDLLMAATAPIDPAPSLGMTMPGRPNPIPQEQPKVSVVTNTISSLLTKVEIEVSEPPLGGSLNLRWLRVENVKTPEDLLTHFRQVEFNAIGADISIALNEQLDFPMQFSIPRPPAVGEYALIAWSGQPLRELVGLDISRMDVVWVFEDTRHETTKAGGSSILEILESYPESAPYLLEK